MNKKKSFKTKQKKNKFKLFLIDLKYLPVQQLENTKKNPSRFLYQYLEILNIYKLSGSVKDHFGSIIIFKIYRRMMEKKTHTQALNKTTQSI